MGEALAYLAAGVTAAWGATREALGGHVPAQRPYLFLFSSPTTPAKPDIPLLCRGPRGPITHSPSAIRLRASIKRTVSNTPGRPARGSAEPTLSTAAAGFARGPSLRAGSWSAHPRAPKQTALPRPGRVPVTV